MREPEPAFEPGSRADAAVRAPPLLLGAALLFWGWQADFFLLACIMAGALEGARQWNWHWEFSPVELSRIWLFCGILFVGFGLFVSTAENLEAPAFAFVRWYPVAFYPIVAAVAFAGRERISLRTLSFFFARTKNPDLEEKEVNLSYPYFAIVLAAASATNQSGPWFYLGLVTLIGWALLASRPQRVSLATWMGVLGLVAGAGYFAHKELQAAQQSVETAFGAWLGRVRGGIDAKEARTSIGQIGRLKMSGRIVMRLQRENDHLPPDLLREASYDLYQSGFWKASASEFTSAVPGVKDSWQFLRPKQPKHSVRISAYLRNGEGILAVPHGTFELADLPALLSTTPMGVVRVENGPGLAMFSARYFKGESIDSPPNEQTDFHLPESERDTLEEIVRRLQLDGKTVDAKLNAIRQFFLEEFSYSTHLEGPARSGGEARTALQHFLTKTRSGHCEYFATATVLLLRAANIPARYAVGYAVSEPARDRTSYVVRERHAHAWCLVYRNDAWEDFDTTPPSWHEIETQRASLFEPISDLKAWLWYQFSKWRWGQANYRYLIWFLIPLSLILIWRILFNRGRKRLRASSQDREAARVWPGTDSEFYLIEQRYAESGFVRQPGETMMQWSRRITEGAEDVREDFIRAATLHSRYRFDPKGLSPEDRRHLAEAVEVLLKKADLSGQIRGS